MARSHKLQLLVLVAALAGALAACAGPISKPPPPKPPRLDKTVALAEAYKGFAKPVAIVNAGDARLFVVELAGAVRIVENGTVLPTPFLDLTGVVPTSGEQGLLGLAFDPEYATNGRFYVHYVNQDGDAVVARYTVSAGNPNVADTASAEPLLTIDRTTTFHNGGQLAFGPDGYLYVASGDGGTGGDPSRDLDTLLGKILRIDVSGPSGYSVPSDNPFVSDPDARPEIWAYGLRNPWRFSFDSLTGDLYIADVGEDQYEELDFQLRASAGGENYGWNVMEGMHCYGAGTCDKAGLTMPVLEYQHDGSGRSITGGYVYRGENVPGLVGSYVFGDFMTGEVWRSSAADEWALTKIPAPPGMMITTFGEDSKGELYLADYKTGTLYRFRTAPK